MSTSNNTSGKRAKATFFSFNLEFQKSTKETTHTVNYKAMEIKFQKYSLEYLVTFQYSCTFTFSQELENERDCYEIHFSPWSPKVK